MHSVTVWDKSISGLTQGVQRSIHYTRYGHVFFCATGNDKFFLANLNCRRYDLFFWCVDWPCRQKFKLLGVEIGKLVSHSGAGQLMSKVWNQNESVWVTCQWFNMRIALLGFISDRKPIKTYLRHNICSILPISIIIWSLKHHGARNESFWAENDLTQNNSQSAPGWLRRIQLPL